MPLHTPLSMLACAFPIVTFTQTVRRPVTRRLMPSLFVTALHSRYRKKGAPLPRPPSPFLQHHPFLLLFLLSFTSLASFFICSFFFCSFFIFLLRTEVKAHTFFGLDAHVTNVVLCLVIFLIAPIFYEDFFSPIFFPFLLLFIPFLFPLYFFRFFRRARTKKGIFIVVP